MRAMQTNGGTPPGPLRFIFSRDVAKRSLVIAVVVGCLLSITNQGDVVLRRGFTLQVAVKILMNFLIPFAVSSASALLNRNEK